MARIAEVIRFYSLDKIMDFIENGGEYPRHHLWCYDQIKENGLSAECIEYNKNSRLNKIGKKIKIVNLQQQLNLLKRSKEFDFIYAPFIDDIFIIAFLRLIGLFRKPILGIAMSRYIPYKNNFVKRQRQKLIRYINFNGFDSLLFLNEELYNRSIWRRALKKTHGYLNCWGADYDFFKNYIAKQSEPPTNDFIFSTGGSGRDFKTLFDAFKEIDFKLKITTKRPLRDNLIKEISPNIQIDNSIEPGLFSVGLIRKEYYNSLAVAIPLTTGAINSPIGVTVLMEAMAMAKPVISTHNKNYPFDLEKEKVGLYVDFNDIDGWRHCIKYLIDNPDEAKEMGLRAQYLSEKRYNYQLFSKEVVTQIKQMAKLKGQAIPQPLSTALS